ncbi:MAG: flagella basal body P-ring formation protein FlgA [Lachnospiraceae bacterium]|nr:flagella basal body P-ring formation protein FlgA [Lachnospiraceae bacterium]
MRKFRRRIIAVCALALVLFAAVIVILCSFYGDRVRDLTLKAENAEKELAYYDSARVRVLCASENIDAGKVIDLEDLTEKDLPADSVPENAILVLSDAVGRTAKIPLSKNTCLTREMLYETVLQGGEREIEYFCIDIRGNVAKGSFVDVRLCFEDGTDYVVLSRKRVEGIAQNRESVILHVDEEELLRMGSAMAELRENDERRIYAVEYPHGELQQPSKVDYVPSDTVTELIEKKERR